MVLIPLSLVKNDVKMAYIEAKSILPIEEIIKKGYKTKYIYKM